MRKKEIIWREILFQAIENKNTKFTQKNLANQFNFSLSTVFHALQVPRHSGAIEVSGKFFTVVDFEKLLMIWATYRNIEKDIIYKTHVDLPTLKIEGELPSKIIFTAWSAYRLKFDEAVADYDKVYIYTYDVDSIKKRFQPKTGVPNLIILKTDQFLRQYGVFPPLAQMYVDLWNLKEWYAKDYLEATKKKM